MTDDGTNIANGFRELRKFCGHVSLLLRTAMTMLDIRGLKFIPPYSVFDDGEKIDEPDRWLPYELCRFFKKADLPLVCYIAINLGHPIDEYSPNLALLSAGCIYFEPGMASVVRGEHWWTRWHLVMNDRSDNGGICIDEPQKTWPEKGWNPPAGIIEVRTFAHPLAEIKDTESLDKKIIRSLVELAEPH